MTGGGESILMDSVAIIEAHRAKCWGGMVHHYQLETVEKCVVEVATGDSSRPEYVVIDDGELRRAMKVHPVTPAELARLDLELAGAVALDDGERHLLAHALGRGGEFQLCTSDRAAIRAAHRLGLLDKFVSLEKLAAGAGCGHSLKPHFTEKWLSKMRTQLFLGEN